MSIFSTEVFKGKHALVTGATGGIGYETAKGLSSVGADVTITGRKEDVLNDLNDEILNDFPDAKVNVAGADLADGGVLEDLTQEELERVMHLNFTVPILLTQRLYDSMKKNKEGAVVNVSSLSGLRGTVGGTAYVGSKFALNGFTQSFALEAIEHNIRVNAVCPGFVDTKMGRDGIKSKGERHGNSFEEQLKIENESLPSGRISTPEDVANTILFLLTDAAENIVGEAVIISGGSLMR